MTVEADIYATLQALVGGRVFPDVAPLDTPRPYLTYQQIGGRPIHYTDNATPGLKHGYFQINVWAGTRASAAALSLQIEDAFRAQAQMAVIPESGPIAQREPDLNLYGTVQDFSIWSSR